MGRTYYLVVIKQELEHEKNKVCIGLDFEPDCDEAYQMEDKLCKSHFPDCTNIHDVACKHHNDMCPLCLWYLNPFDHDNKGVVLDYFCIVLPSFRGNYFMEDFLSLGATAYEYNQQGGVICWITEKNVKDMEMSMKDIPTPLRQSDKTQFNQSQEVLAFLQEWIDKDCKILLFTEC